MSHTLDNAFGLSDALLTQFVALRPVSATAWGVAGHDHAWDDFGPEGSAAVASLLETYRDRLQKLPAAEDLKEQRARLVASDFIQIELERVKHGDVLCDLNNIASPFQNIRMALDVMDTSRRSGWEILLERLATIDRATTSYRASLEVGRRAGDTAALRQVDAAIAQGRIHASESSFFLSLGQSFAKSEHFDPALAAKLERAIAHARGAYADLTDYLEQTYRSHARVDDPVGEARYARKVRGFLGIDIDLRDTFAWGWEQIREIHEEMVAVANAILPSASIEEVIALLETDPAHCARSPEELIEIMALRQQRAVESLSGVHFDIPDPIRRVDVRIAPPGGSALGAYYISPSEDFSRPGTIWYGHAPRDLYPLYTEISTAYHEGFPGHHMQLGMQVSFTGHLSRLHRVAMSDFQTGYAEGWALYAERLMQELGFYERPEFVLGMLANQMMRACRVVLDIGAHLGLSAPKDAPFRPSERIDFDYGVDMIKRLARLDHEHAVSEMTRYLGWPGQAIAYKVGEREILRLRDEMKARRGTSFDLKAFHADVLSTGCVGLGALRELLGRSL